MVMITPSYRNVYRKECGEEVFPDMDDGGY
jgi:hypothetical protein